MGKVAVVSSKVVMESGRMDAGFHVLLAEHSARIETFKQGMTRDEAVALVKSLARKDLTPLSALSRGNWISIRAEDVNRAIDEHPYLCLAIVEEHLASTKSRVDEELRKQVGYAETIDRLGQLFEAIPKPDVDDAPTPGF